MTHVFLQSIVCAVLLVEPCVWQSFKCVRESQEADLQTTPVMPSVHLEHVEEAQPESTEQQDGVALPGMVEADAGTLNASQRSPARPPAPSNQASRLSAQRPSQQRLSEQRVSAYRSSAQRPSEQRLSEHRLSAHRLSVQRPSAHRQSAQHRLSTQRRSMYSTHSAYSANAGFQRTSLATAHMPPNMDGLFALVLDADQAYAATPMEKSPRKSLLPKGIGVPIFLCALFSFMNNWPPSCH